MSPDTASSSASSASAPSAPAPSGPAAAGYDVERVRADFPALHQSAHGHPLAYLDNGATTQKPRAVIDAEVHFYEHDCANVHRGVHALSERATRAFDGARAAVQRFLGAASPREVVFVRGVTEAINLVAHSYARPRLREGDEILLTQQTVDGLDACPPGLTDRGFHVLKGKSAAVQVFGLGSAV